MEGYDIALIYSFFAQPALARKYGECDASGDCQIAELWQAGLGNAVSCGTIVGAFTNGFFCHKFGYRPVLLTSLSVIWAFVTMSFTAPNLPVILGVFAIMTPAYAGEVCPMALREYLTVYVNLVGILWWHNRVGYRIPSAIQWAWPIPLFLILFFAPESLWHFVCTGNLEMAENMIKRLSSPAPQHLTKQKVAMMVHMNELERSLSEDTLYLQCVKGIDLRRTEIACISFAAQPFCGSAMGGAPTYFFGQAGLPNSISFKMSIGGLGLASGLAGLTVILTTVGAINAGDDQSSQGNYAQAGLMIGWLAIYYLIVGPICYTSIAKVSSTKLRSKSVCLSRIVYYIAQIICNVINPYMLDPTAGDWKGKTGYFWGGCSFVFFIWTFFRLPDTKGRSFEEIDIRFAKGVCA